MREFDIYIPSTQSDGLPVPTAVSDQIRLSLLNAFGGFTELERTGHGEWRTGGVILRDAVTIFRVLDDGANGFDMFQFKRNLECVLKQESVLIVERAVRVVGT